MKDGVWGRSTWLSADQVKTMRDDVLAASLRQAVEMTEQEARARGNEDPKVLCMFLTEVTYPLDEEDES